MENNRGGEIVVLIAADLEWRSVREAFPDISVMTTAGCESFLAPSNFCERSVRFLHTGWGKVAAAAGTQLAIDHWNPALLLAIGTCGGLAGTIEAGDVLLVSKTIIYDIAELMGCPEEAIDHYTVSLDLSLVPKQLLTAAKTEILLSADRDIIPDEVEMLKERFRAVAADWESGAMAFAARRNGTPILILKAVTDVVGRTGGPAYGNIAVFRESAGQAMKKLLSLVRMIAGTTPSQSYL